MDDTTRAVIDNIYARRSIRQYQQKPVDREQIVSLLKAAMAAPSACNLQPWEFVVLDEPGQVEAARKHIGGGQFYAPVILLVCARTTYVPWDGNGWMIDCAAAIENLMLAAKAMGLGTLWIGDFDADALGQLLDIPQEVALVSVVYLGHPAEEKAPITRYKEEAVYWGKYDPARPHAERTIQGMIQESIDDARIKE